jgi:hypothetical protein
MHGQFLLRTRDSRRLPRLFRGKERAILTAHCFPPPEKLSSHETAGPLVL